MAVKKIAKPKYLKLPKKPKSSAPLSSWESWHDKAKDIQKKNAEKKKSYEKKLSDAKKDSGKKSKLIELSRKVAAL